MGMVESYQTACVNIAAAYFQRLRTKCNHTLNVAKGNLIYPQNCLNIFIVYYIYIHCMCMYITSIIFMHRILKAGYIFSSSLLYFMKMTKMILSPVHLQESAGTVCSWQITCSSCLHRKNSRENMMFDLLITRNNNWERLGKKRKKRLCSMYVCILYIFKRVVSRNWAKTGERGFKTIRTIAGTFARGKKKDGANEIHAFRTLRRWCEIRHTTRLLHAVAPFYLIAWLG